jgi:UV excision repair protein RAD23
MVTNLTAMGFPEAEVRACLRASQGNPDVAVEYLMNGIPAYAQEIANASNSAPTTTNTQQSSSNNNPSSSSEPLAALRNHPQINQLRQLVQSNPSTLQAVLTQIGQQQPDLLQEINGNQELFLQIMNEPVGSSTGNSNTSGASSTTTTTAPSPAIAPSSSSSGFGGAGNAAALLEGMNNPAQMAQMIQNMSPEQLQAMAQMMGVPPEQLTAMAQLIGQMPPEDFQQHMNMALQQGGGSGLGDFMGGGGAGGGVPPGAQVVRLTEEEMAAVDRLADMGFDRTEAAQAYLACDKNEALAANLLMDGGWGDMDMGGNGDNGDNGDDDDMYD